jgi:hypothetical protein
MYLQPANNLNLYHVALSCSCALVHVDAVKNVVGVIAFSKLGCVRELDVYLGYIGTATQ